jgi:tRNA (guanine37-N1)-methyltransferase
MKSPRAFDFLGNIAIVNFKKDFKFADKKKFAKNLMQKNKSITTVLEKSGKVSGRLRKPTLKYILGEKTKEILYKENNCVFRFNADTTYFSPRLSNERKEIASKIKKEEKVIVMFAGVSPFSIVIAKNSKAKKIYSNEINREANKYGKLNIELNKVKDKIELIKGDIKKIAEKLNKKFDVIVMPRPQLKDSFLKQAFKLSKKYKNILL